MAFIRLSTNETPLKAYVIGLDTNYSFADRVCSWYVNNALMATENIAANVFSSEAAKLWAINGYTPYDIYCTIMADGWSTPVPVKVVEWTWGMSNGLSTAYQAEAAYTALTNKGSTSDFSYLVWNDMVNKVYTMINSLASYIGLDWTSTYASYNNTLMSASNKTITAVRYNSLVCNVNAMINKLGLGGTNLSYVKSGDSLLGSYFVTLATRINQCMS